MKKLTLLSLAIALAISPISYADNNITNQKPSLQTTETAVNTATLPPFPADKLEIEDRANNAYSDLILWADTNNIPADVLPRDYLALTQLTSLNLRGYHLKTLTKDLSLLHNLTVIDLSNNELTQLPALTFPNLHYLDISNNRLSPTETDPLAENFTADCEENNAIFLRDFNIGPMSTNSAAIQLIAKHYPNLIDPTQLFETPEITINNQNYSTKYSPEFIKQLSTQYPYLLTFIIGDKNASPEEKQKILNDLPQQTTEALIEQYKAYYLALTTKTYQQAQNTIPTFSPDNSVKYYKELADTLWQAYQNNNIGEHELYKQIQQALTAIGEKILQVPEYYQAADDLCGVLYSALEDQTQKITIERYRLALAEQAYQAKIISTHLLARSALNLTYDLLFTGNPSDLEEAITISQQYEALIPEYIALYSNHAHALALLGKEAEARALYDKYQDATLHFPEGDISWRLAILDDIVALKKANQTAPLFKEVAKQYIDFLEKHRKTP